jgi:hypothetical protein
MVGCTHEQDDGSGVMEVAGGGVGAGGYYYYNTEVDKGYAETLVDVLLDAKAIGVPVRVVARAVRAWQQLGGNFCPCPPVRSSTCSLTATVCAAATAGVSACE